MPDMPPGMWLLILLAVALLVFAVSMTRPPKIEIVKATEISCPVCGYFCYGRGGKGCIDKPYYVRWEERRDAPTGKT